MSDGLFFAQAPLSGLHVSFVGNIVRFNHIIEAGVLEKDLECNILRTRLIAVSRKQE